MKRLKSILATVVVLTMIFGMETFAGYNTKSYHLEKGVWYSYLCYKNTNTDKFDYRVESVRPDEIIEDTYRYVKIGLKDANGFWIMSERVVAEDPSSTVSYSYPRGINLSTRDYVYFTIRGNNPKLGAWAKVYTNWY